MYMVFISKNDVSMAVIHFFFFLFLLFYILHNFIISSVSLMISFFLSLILMGCTSVLCSSFIDKKIKLKQFKKFDYTIKEL